MFPERRREMIKLDEESVSKIIKIAMSNNQKCNICEFRGMCFFLLIHVSAMIINIIQRGDGNETDTNSRSRLWGGRTLFETFMFI